MHSPKTLTLSSLLLLLSATALALPQPQQPRDPCGPKTQSPSDPIDTCTSTPPLVTEPAAFGVFPFSPTTNNTNNTQTNQAKPAPNNNENNNNKNTTHPACHLAFNNLCATLAEPGIRAEQWYFETAVSPETAVEGRQACQVGFWPPGEEGAVEGLVEGQCERVFGALVGGVGVAVGGGREGASVNLVRGPVGVEGMWVVDGAGEGEGFTGMFFFLLLVLLVVFLFFGFFGFWGEGGGGGGTGGKIKKERMEIVVWALLMWLTYFS